MRRILGVIFALLLVAVSVGAGCHHHQQQAGCPGGACPTAHSVAPVTPAFPGSGTVAPYSADPYGPPGGPYAPAPGGSGFR